MTVQNRSNSKPVLNVVTQDAKERAYVLNAYHSSQISEVKQRWVSGSSNDVWVTPGDLGEFFVFDKIRGNISKF